MGTDNLALQTAKKYVDYYRTQSDVMTAHHAAMDSWDCEAYLQIGIQSYHWFSNARSMLNKITRSGKMEPRPEWDEAIETLYRGWLKTAEGAILWLEKQDQRGYELDNRDEFIGCVEKVRAYVADLDRMNEIAAKVPSASDLDLIVIDPPQEWKNEPSWTD